MICRSAKLLQCLIGQPFHLGDKRNIPLVEPKDGIEEALFRSLSLQGLAAQR